MLQGPPGDELRQKLVDRKMDSGALWLRATDGKMPRHAGLTRRAQCLMSQLRAARCYVTHDVKFRFGQHSRTLAVPADGKHGLKVKDRVVTDVAGGSPAEKARVAVGSTITAVDGSDVSSDAALRRRLTAAKGTEVKLQLREHPSPNCPECGEPDSTEHMLQHCPAYALQRHGIFGTHDPPTSVLRTAPHLVLRFLRKIGRIDARGYGFPDEDGDAPHGPAKPPGQALSNGPTKLPGQGKRNDPTKAPGQGKCCPPHPAAPAAAAPASAAPSAASTSPPTSGSPPPPVARPDASGAAPARAAKAAGAGPTPPPPPTTSTSHTPSTACTATTASSSSSLRAAPPRKSGSPASGSVAPSLRGSCQAAIGHAGRCARPPS